MKMKPAVKYILLLLFYILSAASQTLCLKVSIGVVPVWDAVTLNLSEITGIKIGYFAIALNLITISVWFFLLRKEFKPIRLLSVAVALLYGNLINFFYYDVYTFEITSYAVRIALLIGGNIFLAISLAVITYMDLISFPAEGLCYTLERRFKFPIKITRTALDVLCILVSILLSVFFHKSLKIREGTVISMLMVGPLMGVFMDIIRKRHWLE